MDHQVARQEHAVGRTCGMVAGLALALLLGGISVVMLLRLIRDDGGGLVLLAIFIGIPLFIVALVIWIYLLRKGAAGAGLTKIMWLPVVVSMSILPVAGAIETASQAYFRSSHPIVTELHVNLTGRTMALDPESDGSAQSLPGAEPSRFKNLNRDPSMNRRADKMAAYEGALLAPGFNSMKVFYEDRRGAASVVPVRVLPMPPAWKQLASKMGSIPSENLVHVYYHYPDRVDVLSMVESRAVFASAFAKGTPLVDVFVHNLGSEEIVRLEMNGQPARLTSGIPPASDRCHVFPFAAIEIPDAPLILRWQSARANPAWQHATLVVPPFPKAPLDGGSVESHALHVYIKPDGTLAAQREQQLDLGLFKTGKRVSAATPAFATAPECGLAAADAIPFK